MEQKILEKRGSIAGIDRGVKVFAMCSNGSQIPQISPPKNNLQKIKKLQKRYCHLKNKRKDYLHKATTQLSKNHRIIALEDLKIGNMTKSAKRTVENPGKNVKAKSGLNRSILDQGWRMFQTFPEYKMKYSGGEGIYVNPKNTSIKRSRCKHISKESRKSQSHFECVNCGLKINADLNAGLNILAEGLAVAACGVDALVSTMKQELEIRKPIFGIS